MRILIDTNIFIDRENDHVLSNELQVLLKILNSKQIEICIHPKSIEEIKRDSNISRKNIALSKLNTYPILEHSPDQNKDEIFRNVKKRTVYSMKEIEEMAKNPTLVILFKWHFHLPNKLKLNDLKTMGVSAPQSIAQISDEKYGQIKIGGEIDERFTVN